MPARAPENVFDTSDVYGNEVVNFGARYDNSDLSDLKLSFKSNRIEAKEIDTRNLVNAIQLNLYKSPIINLDTFSFFKLRVLVLNSSKIK